MSSNKNEKSIRNLIRLTKKELKDLRIHDLLADPKLNEAFRRAKPKHWSELTEDEREAQAKEQAEAEQEFVREQKILRIKQFFQSIMKAKCDEPKSRLFITAEELLEFVVKYESSPSSVSNYKWNKFETILLTRLESLLQADGKEEEPTETEQESLQEIIEDLKMAVSNWEQKKKHALELLHKLLDIWQGREPINKIEAIGPQVNEAVLMLDLPDPGLPLPYDDKKMSSMGAFVDVLAAKDRSGGPGDEFSNNINAWIQLIEKAKGSVLTMPVRSSKDNWEAIKSEYDISKRDFGKKINFVSDSFKKKIIFRDVEHAFVLASEGFAKPAVILAGGVIEELLRLYLKHKNIAAADNTFNEYIKACKQNKLLQTGIRKLSDSVREFRNFVHLSKESAKKHSITKAAAKGAVSSIFIIANDL